MENTERYPPSVHLIIEMIANSIGSALAIKGEGQLTLPTDQETVVGQMMNVEPLYGEDPGWPTVGLLIQVKLDSAQIMTPTDTPLTYTITIQPRKI